VVRPLNDRQAGVGSAWLTSAKYTSYMAPIEPQPGDFGLAQIHGVLGWLIKVGQLLNGDTSKYTHAFVVLDRYTVMEAEPRGARVASINLYKNAAVFSGLPLTDEQRAQVVSIARGVEFTPYGFLDYLALALTRFHLPSKWLRRRVADSGHMICSQLVDQVYARAGIHLFDDGRLSQDVTPGDLANLLLERNWIDYNAPQGPQWVRQDLADNGR
jgi:hypothetical protein